MYWTPANQTWAPLVYLWYCWPCSRFADVVVVFCFLFCRGIGGVGNRDAIIVGVKSIGANEAIGLVESCEC